MKILLITPPLTQLNMPYPATTQLQGFLKSKGIESVQMDLSIELINTLFTQEKLGEMIQLAQKNGAPEHVKYAFWLRNIEPVMRFLGGQDSALANRFADVSYWWDDARIPNEEELEWAFGVLGFVDKAKFLCTLFLKDVCDFLNRYIDNQFELIRYAEKLCTYLPTFTPLSEKLSPAPSYIEQTMLQLLQAKMQETNPDWVGFSVPFPGNLLTALRCAQHIKKEHPNVQVVMGGGYVNTELRMLQDNRLFDYIDYLIFDDGELPLYRLLTGGIRLRTLHRQADGRIVAEQMDSCENVAFSAIGTSDYSDLTQNRYIDMIEMVNPMHMLWSNGRWNKMMLSHGCYWAKCTFCDVNLDYIGRYEPCDIKIIVDRMEAIMEQTGQSGFHFVDEAASPAVLRKLSEEILKRGLVVSYWTNIRFEKSFTPELCELMAASGCIAVAGGLEVASPRILKMINKGITIQTAAQSMQNLTDNGILVHAYLMYGFPTETTQETVDSLEVVRQLFEQQLVQSAFWHRYAMTAHSPSGRNPKAFQAVLDTEEPNPFANNEIFFHQNNPIDLDGLGKGLNLATYNYMRGVGFDLPLKKWFDISVPKPNRQVI